MAFFVSTIPGDPAVKVFEAMSTDDAHCLGLGGHVAGAGAARRRDGAWAHDEGEHDACAIIANVKKDGRASHGNVKRTLEALARMGHRTGEVEGEGDGAGLQTDIPRERWAKRLEAAGLRGSLVNRQQ